MSFMKHGSRLATALCLFGASTAAFAAPDLQIQAIAFNTSTNQVDVTVLNAGPDSVAGSSHYLYLYAAGRDIYRYVAVPSAGQTVVTSYSAADTGNLQLGSTYYMYAYADWYSSVSEANESNNAKAANIWIQGSSLPEYRVLSITDMANLPNLLVTYRNDGPGTSTAAPVIRVTAGTAIVNVVGVAAGAAVSQTVMVSKSALGLVYNATSSVSAMVDATYLIAEGSEANNTTTSNVYVTAPASQPDLIVSAIVYDAASSSFRVTYGNNGSASSNGWYLLLAVGSTSRLKYLYGIGASSTATASFPASDFGVVGGNLYSTYAIADAYGNIAESSESNNSASVMLSIPGSGGGGGLPDLVITDMYVSYGTLNIVVKNQGGALSSGFYINVAGGSRNSTFYVSTSIIPGAGMTRTYSTSTGGLNWYGGSLYVTGTVDHWNYNSESNEGNNVYSESLTYTSGQGF